MEFEFLDIDFSICKLAKDANFNTYSDYIFYAKTDKEISLVCPTEDIPVDCLNHDDGYIAFRVKGVLDFSLVGILARITTVLAEAHIPVFAVSTFDTDYILIKKETKDKCKGALEKL